MIKLGHISSETMNRKIPPPFDVGSSVLGLAI